MILEAAMLQVKPGQSEAFEAAFAEAQPIIASMPGYRSHELQRCIERAGHYLLLVRWDSVAAHEEGFRKSPQYQEWRRLLHPFYDPFPTVLHYDVVEGRGTAAARVGIRGAVRRAMAEAEAVIAPLGPVDRSAWEVLARGYKDFYQTPTAPQEYEAAWQRLLARDGVFGLGAKLDGELVGIAHYVLHRSAWAPTVCYLQDLFVAPEIRGKGVARALIDAVAAAAREAGATRYYWQTMQDNTVARALYDKVARFKGFIRYDYPLDGTAQA